MPNSGNEVLIDESTLDYNKVKSRAFVGIVNEQMQLGEDEIEAGMTYGEYTTIKGSTLKMKPQLVDGATAGIGIYNTYLPLNIAEDSDSEKINDIDMDFNAELCVGIMQEGDVNISEGDVDIKIVSGVSSGFARGIAIADDTYINKTAVEDVVISGNNTVVKIDVDTVGDGYGLDNESGNISVIDKADVNIDVTGSMSKGIQTVLEDKMVYVKDATVKVYAGENNGKAIETSNLKFGQTKEMSTEILEASTTYIASKTYSNNELIKYPGLNDSSYKYVKIGDVTAYSYKFDVDNGDFSKVYTDGTSLKLTDLPAGCTVTTNASGEYVLQLENFEFLTTAPIAINVYSTLNNKTKVGNIKFVGTNTITLLEGYNTYADLDRNSSDDGDRMAIYCNGIKECNILGDGTYIFSPINKSEKTSQQMGIKSLTSLKMSLNKYEMNSQKAAIVIGVMAEDIISFDLVEYNVDIDNMMASIAIQAMDNVNVKNSIITIKDSDSTNVDILQTMYGIMSYNVTNISENSIINMDIVAKKNEPLILALANPYSDCYVTDSTLDIDIYSEYAAVAMYANTITTANSTLDYDLLTGNKGAGVGMFTSAVKDTDSTIDINIKDGRTLWGIGAYGTWDSSDSNNDYTLIDMKDTNLTIDIQTDTTEQSEAKAFYVYGMLMKQESEYSYTIEGLAGNIDFDGGSLVVNSKAKESQCLNASVDKVSIRNMDYMEIHNNITDIASAEVMLAQKEAEYNEIVASGEYTDDEIAIYKEMYMYEVGNAIYAPEVEIYNTTGTLATNFGSALCAPRKCDTKGYTKASEMYGEPSNPPSGVKEVIDLDTNYAAYKYVEIEPSVVSVDITWGALNYNHNPGTWDTEALDYVGSGWEAVDGQGNVSDGADKISVTNRSNVPVSALVTYTPEAEYESIIEGKIVKDKITKTLIASPSQILAGNTLDSYLVLEGEFEEKVNKIKIGKVTVLLEE